MLTKQVPNSDILSLLGASAKGSGEASSAAGLKELLGGKLSDFSEVLKTTGSLKDLSGKDLLAFFSKQGKENGEGSESQLSELFSKLETAQGRALLKNFKLEGSELKSLDGKTVSLEELSSSLEKLSKENVSGDLKAEGKEGLKKSNVKLQSAHDFLNSKKAMLRNKSVSMTAKGPKIVASNPALQQYSKETKSFQKNLIRPMGEQRVEKSSSESLSVSNIAGAQSPDADPMMLALRDSSSQSGEGGESKLTGQAAQSIDLSNVSSTNKTELMQKIGQYIENSYVAGSDNIDMVVKHDELGKFRINAQKSGPGSQVNLEINTVTDNAHQFFMENEGELMKALNKSGVKVADFKLSNVTETFKTSFGESRSNMDQGSQSSGERADQQFAGGRSFKQGQGQDKRQRLWQDAKDFSERLHA